MVPLLNQAPTHEDGWWSGGLAQRFSALDGGEWSALRPGRFTAWKKVSSTIWMGCWMKLRAGLDTGDRRSKPDSPMIQPVA
jgi:hypothetical protein